MRPGRRTHAWHDCELQDVDGRMLGLVGVPGTVALPDAIVWNGDVYRLTPLPDDTDPWPTFYDVPNVYRRVFAWHHPQTGTVVGRATPTRPEGTER